MAGNTCLTLHELLAQLLPIFTRVESQSDLHGNSVATLQIELSSGNRSASGNTTSPDTFKNIAVCLNEARVLNSKYLKDALHILADASRDRNWRRGLGACRYRAPHVGWPPDYGVDVGFGYEQWSQDSSQSILQVAVRTLHHWHDVAFEDPALEAVRLISNCCADNDQNKIIVLECGGMELLLRCLGRRFWDEILPIALWNICAESDSESPNALHSSNDGITPDATDALGPDIASIAARQLTMSSTGEADDAISVFAEPFGSHYRHAIKVLLEIADKYEDTDQKEIIAELIERACAQLASSSGQTPGTSAQVKIPEGTRLVPSDHHDQDLFLSLLGSTGRSLAKCNARCNRDIKCAIVAVFSNELAQLELIRLNQVEAFLMVPNWTVPVPNGDDENDEEKSARQKFDSVVYELLGRPEFLTKYTFENNALSSLIVDSIASVERDSTSLYKHIRVDRIPLSSACLLLANLTVTAKSAQRLIQGKLHLTIGIILRQSRSLGDPAIFPAVALLKRLTIEHKNHEIIGPWVLESLFLVLERDYLQPDVHREALSAMLNIMHVYPDLEQQPGRHEARQAMATAVGRFTKSQDMETKIQIGRLIVQVCRSLYRVTKKDPRTGEEAAHGVLNDCRKVTDPIAFLCCNSPNQGIELEGWLGMAFLVLWKATRYSMLRALESEELQQKLEGALRAGDRASSNITLMLGALRERDNQSGLPRERIGYDQVTPQLRQFLKRVTEMAKLPPLWVEEPDFQGDPAIKIEDDSFV